ncbi:MAG: flagellar filament capping protein FliD [Desulfobulbus sp.]|nr:flagellar filament capping protein FliD [Desulfobulbus sp.]
MTIQFGGLATGIDTSTIVEQLMELERTPITRLETDQTWQKNRLEAYTELDTRLKSFSDKIKNLNFSSTLLQRSVKQSSEEFLSASVTSKAVTGASYQVEVVSLAQVQKSVSGGYADKSNALFGSGQLSLTVGGTSHTIEIDETNNSLEGMVKSINEADIGISAAIINTGDPDAPYRMILTGTDVAKEFSLDTSGLTGGEALSIGDPVQAASRAVVRVDTIEISSDSNTISDIVPGVTLDLLKAEEGKTTTLNINVDKENAKSAISAFAEGYNEVISFITGQSSINGSESGVLGGDASINAVKRQLQNMLTETTSNSGIFKTISQLGFETQKDGTLKVNDTTLTKAINTNLDGIVSLLAGEEGVTGVATKFKNYLYDMTNTGTGLLKNKKSSIDSSLNKIGTRITAVESRLEKRQKNLEAQFSAMETLVSGLNSQSSYLTQQMDMLSNMMSGGK